MNNISSLDDTIDMRDVFDRIESLRADVEQIEDADDYSPLKAKQENAEVYDELAILEALAEELEGAGGDEQWEDAWYPAQLIRDRYFTEYAEEMLGDCGIMPKDLPTWMVIDWEQTAKNVQVDYTSVEFEGVTYWYR